MALSPFLDRPFVPLGTHARSSVWGGRCAVPGARVGGALTGGRGVRMTDTGQVPGEGQPENAGTVEQQGAPAPGVYTYLPEHSPQEEDLPLPRRAGRLGQRGG